MIEGIVVGGPRHNYLSTIRGKGAYLSPALARLKGCHRTGAPSKGSLSLVNKIESPEPSRTLIASFGDHLGDHFFPHFDHALVSLGTSSLATARPNIRGKGIEATSQHLLT